MSNIGRNTASSSGGIFGAVRKNIGKLPLIFKKSSEEPSVENLEKIFKSKKAKEIFGNPKIRQMAFDRIKNIFIGTQDRYEGKLKLSPFNCLDYRLLSLPHITDYLENLKDLEVSDYGRNNLYEVNLTIFPKEIGQLTNLETLNCSYNQFLESLPSEIGNLKKLKFLSTLGCDMLKSLPEEIVELKKLVVLELVGNKSLKNVPDSITTLTELKRLDMYNCALETLPENIGCLTNLEKIDLRGNASLNSLPVSFKNLTHLKELELEGTNIHYQDIPEEIRNIPDIMIDIDPKREKEDNFHYRFPHFKSSQHSQSSQPSSSSWGMPQDVRDAFEVLGLPQTATLDDIKKAHRKNFSEHHPDNAARKNWTPEQAKVHEDKTKEINSARDTIIEYIKNFE